MVWAPQQMYRLGQQQLTAVDHEYEQLVEQVILPSSESGTITTQHTVQHVTVQYTQAACAAGSRSSVSNQASWRRCCQVNRMYRIKRHQAADMLLCCTSNTTT
jgi:hypothetical protein